MSDEDLPAAPQKVCGPRNMRPRPTVRPSWRASRQGASGGGGAGGGASSPGSSSPSSFRVTRAAFVPTKSQFGGTSNSDDRLLAGVFAGCTGLWTGMNAGGRRGGDCPTAASTAPAYVPQDPGDHRLPPSSLPPVLLSSSVESDGNGERRSVRPDQVHGPQNMRPRATVTPAWATRCASCASGRASRSPASSSPSPLSVVPVYDAALYNPPVAFESQGTENNYDDDGEWMATLFVPPPDVWATKATRVCSNDLNEPKSLAASRSGAAAALPGGGRGEEPGEEEEEEDESPPAAPRGGPSSAPGGGRGGGGRRARRPSPPESPRSDYSDGPPLVPKPTAQAMMTICPVTGKRVLPLPLYLVPRKRFDGPLYTVSTKCTRGDTSTEDGEPECDEPVGRW